MGSPSNKILRPTVSSMVRLDEIHPRGHLDGMVRSTVEQALNDLLDPEAESLCSAKRYERNRERSACRSGHYERELETKAGAVTL